jgi:NTP pyrophosphatase (non-canonical NTP hydrolase)
VGRVVLLETSSRVSAGQLTAAAWRALAEAAEVHAEAGHPQSGALLAEGIRILPFLPAGAGPAPAALLRERAAATAGPVVWLCSAEGSGSVDELRAALAGTDVEVLVGSVDLPGAHLLDLVSVMDRLRSPGGCPWDASQTPSSLLPFLLEETYEVVEAIEADDRAALREELGDVLLQVVFHARIAEEDADDPWDIDTVADGIVAKLVSRHPHVFADGTASSPAEVEASWEELKRAEKARTSAVDGVPLAQPALALAAKLMSRAERAGVEVPLPAAPGGWVLPEDAREGTQGEDHFGDLLLLVVAQARAAGVDPEAALRAAARRYAAAVRSIETPS